MTGLNGVAARSTAREMARRRRQYAVARVAGRVGVYSLAVVLAVACAAPFLWSAVGAVRESRPVVPSFSALVVRTLLLGGCVVVVTLGLALPAAYSLTRLHRPWRLGPLVFLGCLLPPMLLALPLSRMVTTLGLRSTVWAAVLVHPTITVPVATWLLGGLLRAIPVDLEEQAMIDGYSRFGALTRAVLPPLLPGILAVAVFTFILSAGEFAYATTFGASVVSTAGLSQSELLLVALPLAILGNLIIGRLLRRESVSGVA